MLVDRHEELGSYVAAHPVELEKRLAGLHPGQPSQLERWHRWKEPILEEIHRRVRASYRDLLDQYGYLDPDGDRIDPSLDFEPTVPMDRKVVEVLERLDSLLRLANYRRLTPREISHALKTASAWGIRLRIRFRDFRRLRVYARGEGLERRERREWYLLFRKRALAIPVYRQLVVIYQARESQSPVRRRIELKLRMFKNVPHADLDMLIPGTVRMSLLEQGRIGIPTAWGFLMLVSKLARNLWLLALFGAIKVLTSITFIAAVLIAGVVYSCKLFFSYRHAHNRHLLNITQSLYYQTLSNNAGVVLRLLDEAEQQMACEALLLMHVVERDQAKGPRSASELDQACEQLLNALGMGAVNFDIDRALRFLSERNLVQWTTDGWQGTNDT